MSTRVLYCLYLCYGLFSKKNAYEIIYCDVYNHKTSNIFHIFHTDECTDINNYLIIISDYPCNLD